jgi:hypothetical protein
VLGARAVFQMPQSLSQNPLLPNPRPQTGEWSNCWTAAKREGGVTAQYGYQWGRLPVVALCGARAAVRLYMGWAIDFRANRRPSTASTL